MNVFVYFILIIFIPNYPTCLCNILKTLLFKHIIEIYNININLTPKHEKPVTNYIFYDLFICEYTPLCYENWKIVHETHAMWLYYIKYYSEVHTWYNEPTRLMWKKNVYPFSPKKRFFIWKNFGTICFAICYNECL